MAGLLVSLILLIQGIPVQQGGTVTGILRDKQGMPVPGVRIAAVARPEAIEDASNGAAMAGLAETDDQGRFTLENIPPGRYYIAAGRLDLQTYYPGTQEMTNATVVTITAGATVSGINFALNDTSFGRAPGGFGGVPAITAAIPVRVTVENGGKIPVTSDGKVVTISLQSTSTNPISLPIDGSSISIQGPLTGDFRVTVENLPDTHVVKSVAYGSTDITRGTFRITPSNFSVPATALTTIFAPPPSALPTTQAGLQAYLAGLAAGLAARGQTGASTAIGTAVNTPGAFSSGGLRLGSPASPPSTLSITLGLAARSTGGVRVSGKTEGTSKRLIYISGHPGVLFSDGTFEFRDVPPGRHLIATLNNPSGALAAVVVVGDKDIDSIELKETPLLPADVRIPKDPAPAGDYAPGTIVPLARVTGTVVEESTRTPISEGDVIVKAGDYSRSSPIDKDGKFETFYLLPGTYDLRLQIFGHSTTGPTVVVEDKNITVEIHTRRLY